MAALLATLPAVALAQYPTARLQGRLQAEFRTSDIRTLNPDGSEAAVNTNLADELFVRRAYLEFSAQIAQNVSSKVEVNVTRRQVNLEDAWIQVGLGRFVNLRAGQEKKPVERLEITSSNTYLPIERGAQINGMKNPNLVSQNNFLIATGVTSHDLGASVELHGQPRPGVPVSLRVGVWDGQGKDNPEVNNAKTFGGRLTVSPVHNLSLGASFVSHDDPISVGGKVAVDSAGRTTAFGLDGEWGTLEHGLHVMADAAFGRESRAGALTPAIAALRPTPVPAGTVIEPRFRTFHVVGEYRWLLPANAYVTAVGPVFRWDRTTPDTDNGDIASTFLTPGLNVYFGQRTWLMFNYDVVKPGDALDLGRGPGESVHSFKSMMRIFF